jgi:hypothetical protein
LLLLQSAACSRTHALLELITLRLEYGGAKQRDLLTLLQPAQYLCVIEVADAEPHHARRIFVARLYEHYHRPAAPSSAARATGAASTSAESTALTTEAATGG